ncbi:MAG: anthranilate phosphoribosyltransferase, partial [Megasphaera micronuciformis]
MIREGTIKLVDGNDLTAQETTEIMNEVMSGRATNIETASFLTALQAKGATIEEITACAEVMRKHADTFKGDGDLLEIVGTGGDKSFTFNISTTAAFVAAAGGCRVAKHGNRAATSKSGAADVLEAAGAVIDLDGKQCRKILDETGFCFLFARSFHKAMKYVAPVRQKLSIPTVFNLLGPLTNPAGATVQVLG